MALSTGRFSCALLAFYLLTFSQVEDGANANGVPLHMWKKMNGFKSPKDFIQQMIARKTSSGGRGGQHGGDRPIRPFVPGLPAPRPSEEEGTLFDAATGSLDPQGVEIMSGRMAEHACCVPSMKPVPFPRDNRVNGMLWPTCVNVQRCGGCCGSDILSCVPTEARMVTFYVMNATYPYPGAERFDFEGMASFTLEEHTACDCQCTVQREHCHPTKHTYDADSCRCQCSDTSSSTECPLRKKWSERECACVCQNQYSCYDDEFFDSAACSCQRRMGRIATQSSSAVNPCLGVSCGPTKEPVVSGSSCVCKVDPCSELTCRVQYVAVRVGTSCECRYGQSVGGDVSAGFVDVLALEDTVDETTVVEGGIDLENLGEVELSLPDEEEATTTTARPATRPGRSRGPSRERTLPRSMIPV